MHTTHRLFFLFLMLLFIYPNCYGQEQADARANKEDISSLDGIITALYESISGPAGQERQWDRFRSLFTPDAKLIPSGKNQEGKVVHRFSDIEEYINSSNNYFITNGFFEKEIHRESDLFGNIAHVFSTYVSRNDKDGEIIGRGINSIQLLNDGERWWILNVLWTGERPDNPIPQKYLEN